MHDRFERKPVCCFLSSLFSRSTILFRVILLKTLLTLDSKAIPLQLLQFVRLSFFGILTISASFHSAGSCSDAQISLKSGYSMSAVLLIFASRHSPGMLSMLAALLFFRIFKAFVIFSLPGGSVHIFLFSRLCLFLRGNPDYPEYQH